MSKTLVAYFSASGTTARVAKELAGQLGQTCMRSGLPYRTQEQI